MENIRNSQRNVEQIRKSTYKKYTKFVQDIHRKPYNGKGESVRCRSNNRCDDKYRDKSMAAILLHLLTAKDAETTEQPREDGDFEYKAHGEAEEDESVDVTLEGYEVFHSAVHLVVAEETKGYGENDEVTEQSA